MLVGDTTREPVGPLVDIPPGLSTQLAAPALVQLRVDEWPVSISVLLALRIGLVGGAVGALMLSVNERVTCLLALFMQSRVYVLDPALARAGVCQVNNLVFVTPSGVMLQELVPVVVQLSHDLPPAVTGLGLAVNEAMVGAGGGVPLATVMVMAVVWAVLKANWLL